MLDAARFEGRGVEQLELQSLQRQRGLDFHQWPAGRYAFRAEPQDGPESLASPEN
jgi:hypothetical protein